MHSRKRIILWNTLDIGYACQLFCSKIGISTLTQLKQIHAILLRTNFSQEDTIFTLLFQKIRDFKQLKYARLLFDSMRRPVSEGVFRLVLASNSKLTEYKQIHAVLLTTGLTAKNSLLTLLLESLLQIEEFKYARELFDTMHKPRAYVWNTLLRNYVWNERYVDALSLYMHMHSTSVRPDEFTFPFVLKACAKLMDLQLGKVVHGLVVKFDMGNDAYVITELMAMYAKLGYSRLADFLFESRSDGASRDVVLWNALISAYMQNGKENKSLDFFKRMNELGIKPNAITLVSAISSCAHLGCLEFGRKLHSDILEQNTNNVYVENALIDMYSKCGSMAEASNVFYGMGDRRNVVSWSTMINGYALNGKCDRALLLYSQMQEEEEVEPNHVTMLAVLTACNHAGLVNKGREYFCSINVPTLEHYSTMADLLGRSGLVNEAYSFIRDMPIHPDAAIWRSLVRSCTIHDNIKIGQIAANELYKLHPETASYQILLSNMYAISGRWNDVKNIRKKMKRKAMKKVSGYSLVEINDELYGSGSCVLRTSKDHKANEKKYTRNCISY